MRLILSYPLKKKIQQAGPHYSVERRFAIVTPRGICAIDTMRPRNDVYHQTETTGMYMTLDEWKQSLPPWAFPTDNNIHVNTTIADMVKKYVAPPKRKTCIKLIKPRFDSELCWHKHIYQMIRECDASLLEREDIRDAYNQFIHITSYYKEYIYTRTPYHSNKYSEGSIVVLSTIRENHYPLQQIVKSRPDRFIKHEEMIAVLDIIYEAYLPLYERLKENVIPYMARQFSELSYQTDKKLYTRQRDKYVTKLMELTKKYERETEYLRTEMTRYQTYLDELETRRNPPS